MLRTKNGNKSQREERHSAAWGKRLGLVLLLATGLAFAAPPAARQNADLRRSLQNFPGLLAKAKQGSANTQTVRVIVQYKNVPAKAHYSAMQSRGGRLHLQLHFIRGAAFTIPVNALAALEADPEVASVTIDHPLSGMDDLTNAVTGVSSAWNAGFTGAESEWR